MTDFALDDRLFKLARLLSAVIVLLVSSIAVAQTPLDVSSVSELQSLSPNIAFLRLSPEATISPEEILNGSAGDFRALPGPEMSFGYAADQFWFAIQTLNDSALPVELVFDTNVKFLERLVVYEVSEDGSYRELLFNDESQVFSQRPRITPRLTVPLSWLPGEQKMLLLHTRSGSGMDLRLQIGPSELVAEKYASRLTLYSFFGGVLLTLILINLFYYYAVRRVAHLLYAFQELSILLFMMHIDGFAFQYLWPESPVWNAHATMFFGHLIIVSSAVFTISFLELRKRAQLFYRLTQGIGLVGFIMLLLTPFVESQFSHEVGLSTTAIGSVILFAAGVLVSLRGHRPARYFVMGWLFMSLGAIVYGMANLGFFVLPVDPLLVLRTGILLEGLLLSYGLSDQLKVLQERAEIAHAELLQSTQKRLEEAIEHVKMEQENAKSKEALLKKDLEIARASHDIRQPISSLRMALLGLLRNQKDTATAEVFNRTLDHMEKLLGDRISGAPNADIEPELSYGQIFRQTVEEFASEAQSHGIELNYVDCSLLFRGSQVALKRALNNLLVNAIKHSGGSKVSIGVRRKAGRIELMVVDNGNGEFQLASSNGGAGLGLGIVRELCKDNSWFFDIESRPGKGTCAKIGISR